MSDKMTRKEMQSPDAFQRTSLGYWKKLLAHKYAVVGGLVVLAVVLIAAGLIDHFRASGSEKSGTALGTALATLSPQAPETAAEGAEPKPALKPTEQRQAFVEKLDTLITNESGPAAATALLYRANAQLQLGKAAEAQKDYTAFLGRAKNDDPMRVLALEGLGYAYEAQKNLDEALKTFQQMEPKVETGKDGSKVAALALYHQGRILEEQGKKPEAADTFQRVKTDFSSEPAAVPAGERLASLAAQGVVPSKPAPPPGDATPPSANGAKQ